MEMKVVIFRIANAMIGKTSMPNLAIKSQLFFDSE